MTRVHVMTMIRVGNKKDKVGVYKVGVSSTKFKFTTSCTDNLAKFWITESQCSQSLALHVLTCMMILSFDLTLHPMYINYYVCMALTGGAALCSSQTFPEDFSFNGFHWSDLPSQTHWLPVSKVCMCACTYVHVCVPVHVCCVCVCAM